MSSTEAFTCGKCHSNAPSHRCEDCQLLYCTGCSEKRHSKGAFRRHGVTELPTCDECEEQSAALACSACELNFCNTCCAEMHSSGAMASHEASGSFRWFVEFQPPQPSTSQSPVAPAATPAPPPPSAAAPLVQGLAAVAISVPSVPSSTVAPATTTSVGAPAVAIAAPLSVPTMAADAPAAPSAVSPAVAEPPRLPLAMKSKDDTDALLSSVHGWDAVLRDGKSSRRVPGESDQKYRTWGGWDLFNNDTPLAAPTAQPTANVPWSQQGAMAGRGVAAPPSKYQTLQHLPPAGVAPPGFAHVRPDTIHGAPSPVLSPLVVGSGSTAGGPASGLSYTSSTAPMNSVPLPATMGFSQFAHHAHPTAGRGRGAGAGAIYPSAGVGVGAGGGATGMAHNHNGLRPHMGHDGGMHAIGGVKIVTGPSRGGGGGGRGDKSSWSARQMPVDIVRVQSGLDTRTTLMVRNIPNKYTQTMLLDEINETHQGLYDFFYLPIDFKNRCNVGYAFMNFINFQDIVSFYHQYNGKKWRHFNSEKICQLSYGRIQGKDSLVTRFQNSSLLDRDPSCRPLLFESFGPRKGMPVEFPMRTRGHRRHTSARRSGHRHGQRSSRRE